MIKFVRKIYSVRTIKSIIKQHKWNKGKYYRLKIRIYVKQVGYKKRKTIFLTVNEKSPPTKKTSMTMKKILH